jgi:alanine-glyoxylate transaminase/serine-glyoxylate transaminase/serine-pyruvate transaminase
VKHLVNSLTLGSEQLNPERGDIDHAIKALEEGLAECGYKRV